MNFQQKLNVLSDSKFTITSMSYREPKIRLAKNVSETLPQESTCVIYSIAHVLQIDPNEVWKVARPYWRARGGITNAHISSIIRALGFESKERYDLLFQKQAKHSPKSGYLKLISYNRLLLILDKMSSDDMFLISVRGHCIGVRNSIIVDTANPKTGDKVKVLGVMEVFK